MLLSKLIAPFANIDEVSIGLTALEPPMKLDAAIRPDEIEIYNAAGDLVRLNILCRGSNFITHLLGYAVAHSYAFVFTRQGTINFDTAPVIC